MNISQIAKLAGVAPATVSRYLNNGYVSNEKREKIKKVIAETGYRPMTSAQAMRTGRSHLIAIIVPKLNSESISLMVDGMTNALAGTGYNIILANAGNSIEKELEYLKIFKENDVDGVILTGTVITKEHHEIMLSYKKPIVILGQFDKKYPCVYYDDYGAAYAAVKHMIDVGCKRIANLYVMPEDKAAGKSRMDGYYDALQNAGIEYNEKLVAESDFTINGGYCAMKRLLSKNIRFDGVFCATDTIAFGAKSYMEKKGIRIPEDIKLAAIGDSRMSTIVTPSLTTVHLHHVTGGREACKILLEKIDGDVPITKQYKLGFELCVRESTRAQKEI